MQQNFPGARIDGGGDHLVLLEELDRRESRLEECAGANRWVDRSDSGNGGQIEADDHDVSVRSLFVNHASNCIRETEVLGNVRFHLNVDLRTAICRSGT